jgi:hypothetical protein
VPGDLVEDRGQAESEVLAGPPGVAVGDRQTAQVRGGALDNVTVGTNEVDRVGHCSPEVRSTIGTAGGKPTDTDIDIASGCGRRSVTRARPAPGRPPVAARSPTPVSAR